MSRYFGFPKKVLVFTSVITSTCCLPVFAQTAQTAQNADEEEEIKEVVVTGSYLRGSPLDAPSPVQVIDRTSIEAQGAAQIWDVIKNLEINSGSITNEGAEGSTASMGTLSGTANVNLRNLGENSTLTLINGKRQVSAATVTASGGEFVDINTIPLVMVDRIEVLTDGGSALYGSDAVAGAVNVIMRTQFEGLEIYGDIQGIQKAGNRFDKTGSIIWGWTSESGDSHFVLAGEMFQRDPVELEHARFFDGNSEFSASVGGLGSLISNAAFGSRLNTSYVNTALMAQAGAEGGNANTQRFTDPLCHSLNSADGTPFFTGTNTSSRGSPNATCREYSYQWSLLAVGMERQSVAGAFNHTFNEKAQFYSFVQYSESDIERADSGVYSTRGPSMFLAPPGAHAVAPFGLGPTMELGAFANLVGLTKPTAATITNSPLALANGGPNVPMSANTVIGNAPRTGATNNLNLTNTLGVQAGLKGEFYALNNRRFNYDVSYAWSGTSFELEYKTFQRDRTELAANGLGGPNCVPNGRSDFNFTTLGAWAQPTLAFATQKYFPGFVHTTRESLSLALTSNNHGQGGCMFYNPFLTQMTGKANSQELIDWMLPTVRRADKRGKLGVIDAVVSGELIDMRGGMAQFAVGAQYRMQNVSSRAPQMNQPGLSRIERFGVGGAPNQMHYISNNYECSMCIFNYNHDRNVKAIFTEFSLPFWNNVESQIAVRYEDYGGTIGGELTPKVALSWRPTDELLVRASFSQSFRAPNLALMLEGLEAGGATFRDPIRNQEVRSGMLEPNNENARPNSSYTVGAPAPNVGNEYANTYSTGFIWTPGGRLDGFNFNADFWRFEVKDRVMPQPSISAIAHEIEAFKVAAANPANYVYNGTLATSPGSAYAGLLPFAPCDPVALTAQWGNDPAASKNAQGGAIPLSRLDCVVNPNTYRVDNVVRTVGSTSAGLTTIFAGTINAGEIVSDGVDVRAGYRWDTDWGRIRVSSSFTWVRQYTLIDVPGMELGLRETGIFDAAGNTGDGRMVRSLPDKKGTLSLSWTSNSMRHSASVIGRFVGSYDNLQYQDTYDNGNDYVRSIVNEDIDMYSGVDLQYNYVHEWVNPNLGTTTVTLGLLDAFNATLPFHYNGAQNYDAVVFDGRGRRIYARALMQF